MKAGRRGDPHTVATWLYEIDWVPERQISKMLWHLNQTELVQASRIYAVYRPEALGKVVRGLEEIWLRVSRSAKGYSAGHLLDTEQYRIVEKVKK